MKKGVLGVVIIGVVVLISFIILFFILPNKLLKEIPPSDGELEFCDSDSDCIFVESTCNWSSGGVVCCQTTINKKYEDYWLDNLLPKEGDCEGITGGLHESYLKVPGCIENKCVLSKFKPMGRFNCNRLLIPQNFEPPLDGPPYPIDLHFYSLNKKGQHFLQVDDNIDFSSPINEISVEKQMRAGKVLLDEGIYYWRVKDINSGLWSDACNLTISSHS